MQTKPITIPLGHGGAIVEATFVSRPNRFLVEALLDGALVKAHLADRGRLKEILLPSARLLLAHREGAGRATQFQAVAAYLGESDRLASIDTALPNRLVEAALRAGALPPFAGCPRVRREATIGQSRFDFLLEGDGGRCIVEVKSAGLVLGGIALFPDAPTERGRRHVAELAELAAHGQRCAVVFIAQGQAYSIAMNTAIDPAFAAELDRARQSGLEIYGYSCPLTPEGITLGEAIAVSTTGH
jgi:sugar fermentation stimulation protein A